MRPIEETHGPKFELTRHFLSRMFDSELFSTRAGWRTAAVSAAAAILPAVLLSSYAGKYRKLALLPSPEQFRASAVIDELTLLTLVMAGSGLIALMQWPSLFPSKRDYLALAGLPVRSRQVFVSRFAAVLLFTTAAVLVINLVPSFVIPLEITGRWQKNPSLLVNITAYGMAATLACYFTFFAVMALQGALLNLLPRKWFTRISAYAQGVGVAIFCLAGLFSWSMSDWGVEAVNEVRTGGGWAPPVWFTGLHESMLGDRDPFFAAMTTRAVLALSLVIAATLLSYLIGYHRYRRLLVEMPDHSPAPRRWEGGLLRLIARDPQREAIMQFMAKTLARSRAQRIVLLAYVGAGAGLIFDSMLVAHSTTQLAERWYQALQLAVLYAPLALSAVLLPGFRHVCALPAELCANWIFRATESIGRAKWMSAVERFCIVCVIGPIYLVVTPIAFSVLGWHLALRMTVLQVLASLTMFEVLFNNWQQLPFACSYMPGKRPVMAVVSRAFAGLFVLVPALSVTVLVGSKYPRRFPIYVVCFAAAWLWTRKRRREGWGEARLIYEDIPEVVTDLGISELGCRRVELPVTDPVPTGYVVLRAPTTDL